MRIFCIIPAYNEAKTIESVINQVKPLVDTVVVVDDCSRDETYKLAKNAGIVAIHHFINRGQGAALQTGDSYALKNGADLIVHFDADNQFLASEINDVIKPILDNEADITFGSRFLGKESNLPWSKKNIIMPLARFVNKTFFGITLTDPQSGFRAFNRAFGEKLQIENDGMAHCSEILAKAYASKLRIKEIPITVIYHEFGQKFGGGFKIIKDLFYKKLIK
jgi:glycosyltransferase involved in cell wall biosynthesis